MKRCLKILLSIIAIVWAVGPNLSNIQAAEHRHHEAHEHGVAHMNVAFEGNELYIELISPAANIVGFEHQPRTQEQKAAVKAAIKKLEAGEKLFAFPSGAGDRLVKSKVHPDINSDSGHESDETKSHENYEISRDAGHEAPVHRRWCNRCSARQCRASIKRTISANNVSSPAAVTVNSSGASRLSVPANTRSPGLTIAGKLSPVTKLVSTSDTP